MLQLVYRHAFSSPFLLRCRPKHLASIVVLLTFVSMSVLLLRSDHFKDDYFGVVEIYKGISTPTHPSNKPSTLKPHPMERLIKQARVHFKNVTSRQSRTLTAAIKEYERRYNRTVCLARMV